MAHNRYNVVPNERGRGNDWKVEKNGRTKKTYSTKSKAKKAARRMANKGDELVLHRRDGTIHNSVTVRS